MLIFMKLLMCEIKHESARKLKYNVSCEQGGSDCLYIALTSTSAPGELLLAPFSLLLFQLAGGDMLPTAASVLSTLH